MWVDWEFYRDTYSFERPIMTESDFDFFSKAAYREIQKRNFRGIQITDSPLQLKDLQCELADDMFEYKSNLAGTEGLKSESNAGYGWTKQDGKERKTEIDQLIRDRLVSTTGDTFNAFVSGSL